LISPQRRRWFRVAVLASCLPFACRGDSDPFRSQERPPYVEGQQTFSAGNDRSPAWSADGRQIYYSAEGFGELATSPGVLLAFTLQSGISEPLFPNVQSPGVRGDRWLVAPDLSVTDLRLAFIEIQALWDAHPCSLVLTDLACSPERNPAEVERPPLMQIAVRVRRLDSTGPLEEDPRLEVRPSGVVHGGTGPTTDYVHNYPFQQLFASEGAFTFRASWAPNGERVVLSDGLRLLIWTVGESTADTLPGVEDAAWPAWSPDGLLIAFSRLERADSMNVNCDYIGDFGLVCSQIRTEYMPGRHVISIVQPDGSGLTELGEGDEPAWSPDGSTIYFRHADQIWRMAADGSGTEPIPGTDGGREPAVSPDGALLAFARESRFGDYDIWVTRLEP
jgi:hypothetical protein